MEHPILAKTQIYQSFRRGEGCHLNDEVFWRADGSGFSAECWSHPIRSGGEILGSVVTFLDITERKRAEREKARLTAILEATTDFVAIADLSGKILYMNRGGRKLLGFDENGDLSDKINMDSHPAWAAQLVLNEGIPTALRNGAWSGETALLSGDGREVPVSQVILSHKSPDGTVQYLSTIMRDSTERKRAETELRRAKEAAEAAEGRFSSLAACSLTRRNLSD